jgi:hypothetical protein
MMSNLRKVGGIAALIGATVYVVGFALYAMVLDSSTYIGPVRKVAFLIENQSVIHLGNLLIYIIFGIVLVVLTLALYERLKTTAPIAAQLGAAFGLIWAGLVIASGMIFSVGMNAVIALSAKDIEQAASLYLAIGTVQNGLGGGIEIVGGLWLLMVSWAAWKSNALPMALNCFGALIGMVGVLTVLPGADFLVEIFGLSQIIWFIWLGVILLGARDSRAIDTPAAITV